MRLAILFVRFGPYHLARLNALGKRVDTIAIELSGLNRDYPWDRIDDSNQENFVRIRPFPNDDPQNKSGLQILRRIASVLHNLKPDVVAVPGWSEKAALAALNWCVSTKTASIVMSDSHSIRRRQKRVNELIKRRLIGLFNAGFVAGAAHSNYLQHLGMKKDLIHKGYDVVDNLHFRRTAHTFKNNPLIRSKLNLPDRYFLSACRFIPEKNLPVLLRGFAKYREISGPGCWKLVLVGDGALKPLVLQLQSELNLNESLILPGFQQYQTLPIYYGLAEAFILSSISDTWGLSVNEAMASGLPVLVSRNCGCAPDLVEEGRNGFTFDPYDVDGLAKLLGMIASDECDRESMGQASREIIARWTPETFAKNLSKAAEVALNVPLPKPAFFDRLLLWALIVERHVNSPFSHNG